MSIRNRIFCVFALAIALAVFGVFNWMRSDLRPRYLQAQEDLLVDISRLLAAEVELASARDGVRGRINVAALRRFVERAREQRFEAWIYALKKTRVNLRVYVTDARGTVIFDSDHGRDLGQDYSRWHDVLRTLQGRYGARSSHGDPMFPGGSTMYVAAPITRHGDIVGVLSVGKPTRNAERLLASTVRRFSVVAVLIVLLALAVSLLLYAWVSRPLRQLHQYAEDLQSGRRVPPPKLGHNEIGRVGRSMAGLRRALDGKTYIERYVQSLTHELKSPTAAIAGAAELLAEDLPEPDRQRFLANISHEAARLRALIERMLELAEIENREALDAPASVHLPSLVDDALDSLAPALARKHISVDRHVPPGLALHGDALLLQRALVNLLDNAIDFSPAGGRIRITAETDGGDVLIRITDAGAGIPDYASARVFERFYSLPRADGSKGTGLGLSFVRQIAELHCGGIRLLPGDDGGTRAELRLNKRGIVRPL